MDIHRNSFTQSIGTVLDNPAFVSLHVGIELLLERLRIFLIYLTCRKLVMMGTNLTVMDARKTVRLKLDGIALEVLAFAQLFVETG